MTSPLTAETHYEVLGISEEAEPSEIKAAYRALAWTHHPDRPGSNPGDEKRLIRVNAAKTILLDPVARMAYDNELRLERWQRTARTVVPRSREVVAGNGDHLVAMGLVGLALWALSAALRK